MTNEVLLKGWQARRDKVFEEAFFNASGPIPTPLESARAGWAGQEAVAAWERENPRPEASFSRCPACGSYEGAHVCHAAAVGSVVKESLTTEVGEAKTFKESLFADETARAEAAREPVLVQAEKCSDGNKNTSCNHCRPHPWNDSRDGGWCSEHHCKPVPQPQPQPTSYLQQLPDGGAKCVDCGVVFTKEALQWATSVHVCDGPKPQEQPKEPRRFLVETTGNTSYGSRTIHGGIEHFFAKRSRNDGYMVRELPPMPTPAELDGVWERAYLDTLMLDTTKPQLARMAGNAAVLRACGLEPKE